MVIIVKKSLICLATLFIVLMNTICQVSAEYTYIDWENRAEGKSYVTAYKDDNIFIDEESTTVEISDPLSNYEIAAFQSYSAQEGTSYGLRYNIYNIVQRFNNGVDEFSFTLSSTTGDIFILENKFAVDSKKISEIAQSGWEFGVINERFVITVSEDENDSAVVTVKRSENPDDESSPAVLSATYDVSLCKVAISAYIPGCTDELINIFLVDKDNSNDIGYIEQVMGGANDRFRFEFKFLKDIENYKLNVYHNSVPYEVPITKIDTESISQTSLVTDYNNGTVSLYVDGNEAFYGTNKDCRLLFGYYKSDGTLIDVDISHSWEDSFTQDVPAGTSKIKCYVWESFSTLTPLADAQEIIIPSE